MLKIALTDDHAMFRKSLKLLLHTFTGMEVVLDACNGVDLLEKLTRNNTIDVLLLDLQMPVMGGFEAAQKVRQLYPGIKIMILTHLDAKEIIKRVVETGVHGFCTKGAPPEELEDAIRQLDFNGFYYENSLTDVFTQILNTKGKLPVNKNIVFTITELEVIKLTAQGLKANQIADALFISTKTVNAHNQNIQQKYNFDTMMGAVVYCLQEKIIDLDTLQVKYR